jgi:hypothetical protein
VEVQGDSAPKSKASDPPFLLKAPEKSIHLDMGSRREATVFHTALQEKGK